MLPNCRSCSLHFASEHASLVPASYSHLPSLFASIWWADPIKSRDEAIMLKSYDYLLSSYWQNSAAKHPCWLLLSSFSASFLTILQPIPPLSIKPSWYFSYSCLVHTLGFYRFEICRWQQSCMLSMLPMPCKNWLMSVRRLLPAPRVTQVVICLLFLMKQDGRNCLRFLCSLDPCFLSSA